MANININPIVLEKGLRAEFLKSFKGAEDPKEIAPFVMQTQSTSNKEKYGWLGQTPQLTEWTDERQIKGLLDYNYEILNKRYESTIGVDEDNIDDDQIGALKLRIADLAVKAKRHPVKLFYELLEYGTTGLAYDGLAFFSNSHTEGDSGTQDNLLSGNGITVANFITDLKASVAAMRGFKDDTGEVINEEMDLYCVVPLGLEFIAREALNASLISSTDNVFKGAAKLVVAPRLTDANDWYLLNGSGMVKPFIQQNRKAPTFASLEKNSDKGFMNKVFAYGVDYRVGFGYGLWQKAVKVVNT